MDAQDFYGIVYGQQCFGLGHSHVGHCTACETHGKGKTRTSPTEKKQTAGVLTESRWSAFPFPTRSLAARNGQNYLLYPSKFPDKRRPAGAPFGTSVGWGF